MDLSNLSLSNLSQNAQIIIGAVLLGALWLYQRYQAKKATPSTIPSPTPNVATMPALLAGVGPLLHDALVALGGIIPAKGATVDDVPHSILVQLAKDIANVIDSHNEIHDVAKVQLQPTAPAASVTPTMPTA